MTWRHDTAKLGKRKFTELIHFVDWFPTILKLAGHKSSDDTIDGISADWIFKGKKKPKANKKRRNFIYGVKHEFIGDEWIILYRNIKIITIVLRKILFPS